ncbi:MULTISPECIES: ribosome silencing factor [unclassified Anaerobiospirillum]|mgnify:CR=1 FL=1|uniref:ribosome silencing factor n=1 Tax=unclassified Anaerobiospirillum TaxID=2647410 RepID=UPI001FF6367F|nr:MULTISPECIES: ribosome silencing factor [unclassified Anaerobiospirillum]MCK0527181.1 ribosome silencing factor [Anaerobiospirillum sp. NML120449]MCK0535558.1 ribosome silencing factor [Anaerobiospirillum sp. NML120511]MCK0539510.1 ribosome silencing factor [Anaerobiospirillum sp. NML02-A-032]
MYSSKDYTTEQLLELALASLDSSKAQDTVHIDVHEHCSIADVMVITTGTSNRHVSAMADRLVEYLAKHDIHGVSVSGEQEGKWVIVDIDTVMVHILQESERQRYQLENLYKCMAAGLTEDEA